MVCQIESKMELLGATGVEDTLQEGVPDTLETLRAAGNKVGATSSLLLELALKLNLLLNLAQS